MGLVVTESLQRKPLIQMCPDDGSMFSITFQARTQDFLKGGSKIEMKRKVTKMLLSLQKSINNDCVGSGARLRAP